jgi:UDP-N-acetylmuramoyl-tripeptide--D-alanyl-D-alanine ligase
MSTAIIEIVLPVLLYLSWLAFACKRALTYMHAFQQEEYDAVRFFRWIGARRVFDKRLTLGLFLIGLPFMHGALSILLVFSAFTLAASIEKDPRRAAKKKLVFTARVKRIFIPAFILLALIGLACLKFLHPWFWISAIQSVPFVLAAANMALKPTENTIQKKYWNEAHDKIQALAPRVIAVTGSFGKTSVKHILGHVLKVHAPTLMTPGSVNTPMGITRIVRENLDENHKYFVVEMGAYGPGSIERLCRLAPPDLGIITAVGHAHYERFKSLETVAHAKFELARAVLAKNGQVIVHEDTLRFPETAGMKAASPDRFIVCGDGPGNDLKILSLSQEQDGLRLLLSWKGQPHELSAPLFGLHHGQNIALAFAAAMTLGIDPEGFAAALRSVPQIAHRLEVKKQDDGTILIDDAFNSNPAGFRAALDLLGALRRPEGRAILITPGMVELGQAHDAEHEALGRHAGKMCDIALVIAPARIGAFIEGFKATGPDKILHEMKSFPEASAWLDANRRPGDVILIENDLPDIYERVPRI